MVLLLSYLPLLLLGSEVGTLVYSAVSVDCEVFVTFCTAPGIDIQDLVGVTKALQGVKKIFAYLDDSDHV